MTSRSRRKSLSFPFVFTDLAIASWETIARRSLLMAHNCCSPLEYQRMIHEKMQAAAESGMQLWKSGGCASLESLLAPWAKRAAANAKRLRKR